MKTHKYVSNSGLAFAEKREMDKLSRYAREGWHFESFARMGFSYKLVRGEPRELQYSIDHRANPDEEYFDMFRLAGWECVCSEYTIHIFAAPKGTTPIYTEKSSLIDRYTSEKKMLGKIALPALLVSILLMMLQGIIETGWLAVANATVMCLVLIVLVFTGLPYLSYTWKIGRLHSGSELKR